MDAKFGIEAEYALVRPDGQFADFTNTRYAEVRPVIDELPDYRHAELRVCDAGVRVKNWYVEGDERFDDNGRSTGLAFKGIEIRTPVCPTIDASIASLKQLRSMLASELEARSWSLVVTGFNPHTATYEPGYTDWEKRFHASHIDHRLPEISTLSYGPDLNFSRRGDSPEKVIETVRRLTYYSPYVVPFSFNSPMAGGKLWDGLSYRTYRRTGPRPAALAHLAGRPDHPLVKKAEPPSQHLRIEYKAFDMVENDALLAELFHLIFGLSLADDRDLPGRADLPDAQFHQRVARSGFGEDDVHEEAIRLLAVASDVLRSQGIASDLPLLNEMLATRRTPAHRKREQFTSQTS